MNVLGRLSTLFDAKADMLGFAANARPTAHEWLVAFTDDFMGHADAVHSTGALMSGLRFYTPAFVTEIAGLPPVEEHERTVHGNIPKAVYNASAFIITDAYQRLISRNAGSGEIQAAFARATPTMLKYYEKKSMR